MSSDNNQRPIRRGEPGGNSNPSHRASTELPNPVNTADALAGQVPVPTDQPASAAVQPVQTTPVKAPPRRPTGPLPALPDAQTANAVQRTPPPKGPQKTPVSRSSAGHEAFGSRLGTPEHFMSPNGKAFRADMDRANALMVQQVSYTQAVKSLQQQMEGKTGVELLGHQAEIHELLNQGEKISTDLDQLMTKLSPIAERAKATHDKMLSGSEDLKKAIKLRDKFLEIALQEFMYRSELSAKSGNSGAAQAVVSAEELEAMVVRVDLFSQRAVTAIEGATPQNSPVVRAYTPSKWKDPDSAKNTLQSWLVEERKVKLDEKRREALDILADLEDWEYRSAFKGLLGNELDKLSLSSFDFFEGLTASSYDESNVDDSPQIGKQNLQSQQKVTVMLAAAASLRWYMHTLCLFITERELSASKRDKREEALGGIAERLARNYADAEEVAVELFTLFEEEEKKRDAIDAQLQDLAETVVPVSPMAFLKKIEELNQLPPADRQRGLVMPVVVEVIGGEAKTERACHVLMQQIAAGAFEVEAADTALAMIAELEHQLAVDTFLAVAQQSQKTLLQTVLDAQLLPLIEKAASVVLAVGNEQTKKEILFSQQAPIWQLVYDAIQSGGAGLFPLLDLVAKLEASQDKVEVFVNPLSTGNPLLFDILQNYPTQINNMWRILQELNAEGRMQIWNATDAEGIPLWKVLLQNDVTLEDGASLFDQVLADIGNLQSAEKMVAQLKSLEQDQAFIWQVVSKRPQSIPAVMAIVAGLETPEQMRDVFLQTDSAGRTFLHLLIEQGASGRSALMSPGLASPTSPGLASPTSPDLASPTSPGLTGGSSPVMDFADFVSKNLPAHWSDLLKAVDNQGRNPLHTSLLCNPASFDLLLSALQSCNKDVNKAVFSQQTTKEKLTVLHAFVQAYQSHFSSNPDVGEVVDHLFTQLRVIADGGRSISGLIAVLSSKNSQDQVVFHQALTDALALVPHFLKLAADFPVAAQVYNFLVIDPESCSSVLGRLVDGCPQLVPDVLKLMADRLDSKQQMQLLTACVGLGLDASSSVIKVDPVESEEASRKNIMELESTLIHQVFESHPDLRAGFIKALSALSHSDCAKILRSFGGSTQQMLVQIMIAGDLETAKATIAMVGSLPLQEQQRVLLTRGGNGDNLLMTVAQVAPGLMDMALAILDNKKPDERYAYFTQVNEEGLYLLQLILMHAPQSVSQFLSLLDLKSELVIKKIFTQGSPAVFEFMLRRNAGIYMIPDNARSLREVMQFLKRLDRQSLVSLLLCEELKSILLDERVIALLDDSTITALISKTQTDDQLNKFLRAQQKTTAAKRQSISDAVGRIKTLQDLQAMYKHLKKSECAAACNRLIDLLQEIEEHGPLALSQYLSGLQLNESLWRELRTVVSYQARLRSAKLILDELSRSFGLVPRLKEMSKDVVANANLVIEVAANYRERLLRVLLSPKGFEAMIDMISTDTETFSYLVDRVSILLQPEGEGFAQGSQAKQLQELLLRPVILPAGRHDSLLNWVVQLNDPSKTALLVRLLQLLTPNERISCLESNGDHLLDFAVLVSNERGVDSVAKLLRMAVITYQRSSLSAQLVPYLLARVRSAIKKNPRLLSVIFQTLSGLLMTQEWQSLLFDRRQPLYFSGLVQSNLTGPLQMMAIQFLLCHESESYQRMLGDLFSAGEKKKKLASSGEASAHYGDFMFLAEWSYHHSRDLREELGVGAEIIRFNLRGYVLRFLERWVSLCLSRGEVVPAESAKGFSQVCGYLHEIKTDPNLSALWSRPSKMGHQVSAIFGRIFHSGKLRQTLSTAALERPSPTKKNTGLKLDMLLRYVEQGDRHALVSLLQRQEGMNPIRFEMTAKDSLPKIKAILYAIPQNKRATVLLATVTRERDGSQWSLFSQAIAHQQSDMLLLLLDLVMTISLQQQIQLFKRQDMHGKPMILNPLLQQALSADWLVGLIHYAMSQRDVEFADALAPAVKQQYDALLMQYYALAKTTVELQQLSDTMDADDRGRIIVGKWLKRFKQVMQNIADRPDRIAQQLSEVSPFIAAMQEKGRGPEVKQLLLHLKDRFLLTPLTKFLSNTGHLTLPIDQLMDPREGIVQTAKEAPALGPLAIKPQQVKQRLELLSFIQWQLEASAKQMQPPPYQLTSCLSQVTKLVNFFAVWQAVAVLSAAENGFPKALSALQEAVKKVATDSSVLQSQMKKVSESLSGVAIDQLPELAKPVVRALNQHLRQQESQAKWHASLWVPRGGHHQRRQSLQSLQEVPYARRESSDGCRSHASSLSSLTQQRSGSGAGKRPGNRAASRSMTTWRR